MEQLSHQKLPMEVKDAYWVFAFREKGIYPKSVNPGKWLIFVSVKDIDAIWMKIRKATEDGLLGDSAKSSTAKDNGMSRNKNSKVICVYTYDWKDKNDVFRIRSVLRELGITWEIGYKTDEDTIKGKYALTGNLSICKYRA